MALFDFAFSDAGGGERMFETGAVPSQNGTGRGPDGEGLAAAPHEESQSEHQLDPALRLRSPTCRIRPVATGVLGLALQLTRAGISDYSGPLSMLIWRATRHVTSTLK